MLSDIQKMSAEELVNSIIPHDEIEAACLEELRVRVQKAETKSRRWFDGENWIELDPEEVMSRREQAGRELVQLRVDVAQWQKIKRLFPRTADEEIIVPGMTIFYPGEGGPDPIKVTWIGIGNARLFPCVYGDLDDGEDELNYESYYSSPKAIKEAKK